MLDYQEWLEPLGLAHHAAVFSANELGQDELFALGHDDLREGLGVAKFVERKKLLAAIADLRDADAKTRPRTWPGGLDPEHMPAYMAHPWEAMCVEEHPRLKLHWLTDTAELVVRWAVTLTLAEVLHEHDYQLPSSTARAVRDNIERPTLGRWLAVLRALCEAKPKQEVITRGAFELYEASFAPLFEAGSRGASIEDSILELRNQIAHGGGMSPTRAEQLLALHQPRLEGLLRAVMDTTEGASPFARQSGNWCELIGPRPSITPAPAVLSDITKDGAWLARGDSAIPLLPLAIYEPVHVVDGSGELKDRPGGAVAQVFTRAYHDRLTYTPLGRDEAYSESLDVSYFRSVFRLDEQIDAPVHDVVIDGRRWDDSIRDARVMAEDLVGRKAEIKEIKTWMKSRDSRSAENARLGWIGGGPGLGKSMVMARLATDYSGSRHRGFFFHRFLGGNARAARRAFLRFLEASLYAWGPIQEKSDVPVEHETEDSLIEALLERLALVEGLESPNPKAPAPSFWVLVDNLDEIAGEDPGFVDLLERLALPGLVVLASGRSEHGLDAQFATPTRENIFEGGLPVMSAPDIRAVLLEGLGNARYTLLRQDEDDGEEGVHNTFVERVVERARGLPLYVGLLLDDLRAGTLEISNDAQLPDGLGAYYDGLMERTGLSTVSRDLPLLVGALSISEEALDASALSALACPHAEDLDIYERRVGTALRASQSLLRRVTTPDGTQGYTVYHQSFREYLAGEEGEAPAASMAEVIYEARRRLVRLASQWETLPEGNLRNHLFRWGTTYAIAWGDESSVTQARERLTSYAYLDARMGALDPSAVVDLVSEYSALVAATPEGEERNGLRVWGAFFRERAHILARATEQWPAPRVLMQLAVEHADTSPVTSAVEEWIERGNGQWLWLRRPTRPYKLRDNFALRVFEGHREWVTGTHLLSDGRILTWARDHKLRLWDLSTGEELAVFEGHDDIIEGVMLLEEGAIALSYGRDGTLRSWNIADAEPGVVFEGHEKTVLGATMLSDGRLLSWSEDKTLRVWDWAKGKEKVKMTGHTRPMRGATMLSEDRVLSWSEDKSLRLWSLEGEELAAWQGHTREVVGAHVLDDGRVLSWDMDNMLRLWTDGADPLEFAGHEDTIVDVMVHQDHIYSWSKDATIRRWTMDGELQTTFAGHKDIVSGVLIVSEEQMVSWSKDKTLIVWGLEKGKKVEKLEGHAGWVRGARMVSSGELLTWSGGGTLRLWDTQDWKLVAVLAGHTAGVFGAVELEDQELLSWSWDGSLRLWSWERDDDLVETPGHRGWINGCAPYEEGRVASWATDGLAMLWDLDQGLPEVTFQGHEKGVSRVVQLDPERMLTYGSDMQIRTWDRASGACLHVMEAHAKKIQGVKLLGTQRAISYSSDATIKLWDLDAGELLGAFEGHKKLIQGVELYGEGRMVSWSSDSTIKVWDVEGRELVHDLSEHKKLIKGAKVLAGGKELLSWSSDKLIKLWDLETGACLHTFEGHSKIVEAVRFLDDRRAMSLSKDGKVLVWDVEARALLHELASADLPESGALLEDGSLLLWLKKPTPRFVRMDLETAEVLEEMTQAQAMEHKPSWWRTLQRTHHFRTLHGPWRGQGVSGGATLYHDREDGTCEAVVWKDTGSWTTMVLDPSGVLTAHAGPYFYPLHLHFGGRHVTLEEASALLTAPT